jgi:hypothetical protein
VPVFRPGKPRFVGLLSAAYTVAAGGTAIPWDAAAEDGDFNSHPTGGVEIAVAGLYLCLFSLERTAGTGAQSPSAGIFLNGGQVAGAISVSVATVGFASCGFVDELVGGDQVVAKSMTSTTGGKQVGTASRFSVVRIGPVRWT